MMYLKLRSRLRPSSLSKSYNIRLRNFGRFSFINFLKICAGHIVEFTCVKIIKPPLMWMSYFEGFQHGLSTTMLESFIKELIPFWFNFTYLYRDMIFHSTAKSRGLVILESLALSALIQYSTYWAVPISLRPLAKIFIIFKITSSRGPHNEEFTINLFALLVLKYLVGCIISPAYENSIFHNVKSNVDLVYFVMYSLIYWGWYCHCTEFTFILMNSSLISILWLLKWADPLLDMNYLSLTVFFFWYLIFLIRKFTIYAAQKGGLYYGDPAPYKIDLGPIQELKKFSLKIYDLTFVALIIAAIESSIIAYYSPDHLINNHNRKSILNTFYDVYTKRGSSRTNLIDVFLLYFSFGLSFIGGFTSNSIQTYITSSEFYSKIFHLEPLQSITSGMTLGLKIDHTFTSKDKGMGAIILERLSSKPVSVSGYGSTIVFYCGLIIELIIVELILLTISIREIST